jgi:flagellar hook-associated protein FlgK
MTLSLALTNALSGLNINQQSLSILSQNIANANTQGYVRKTINQTAVYIDGRGAGVAIEDVGRKVDEYLLRSMRLQGAVVGRNTVANDYAARTQLLLGKPGSQNSLPNYLNGFFNATQSLAQTPENTTLRVGLTNDAATLTREVRTLANSLQDMRLSAENEITQSIGAVNRILRDLRSLNATIINESVLGKNVGELKDKRDEALRQLSQYMDIDTYVKGSNEINVFTSSGASLLDDNAYQLVYNPQSSIGAFTGNANFSSIQVYRLDDSGALTGSPVALTTSGPSSQVVSALTGGKLRGLLDMRDKEIPALLSQLDRFTAGLRDEFNRVHNSGTGFPGANSLSGTQLVNASNYSNWSGSIRMAVLDSNGRPVASPYSDETSGVRPLNLDLSRLSTGTGTGQPSVQGIINEINSYFAAPQNKAMLGDINNIRLASNNTILPGSPAQFNFDLDLENITGRSADVFVTGVEMVDNQGNTMPITQDVPKVPLAATGTYNTVSGTNEVIIQTQGAHGLVPGQTIYLPTPPGNVNGLNAAALGGYFTVGSVTADSFSITVPGGPADSTGPADVPNLTVQQRYKQVAAGEYGRTTAQGTITADLSSNPAALYYTVRLTVGVKGADGAIKRSQITYQVDNNQSALLNRRYAATSANGDATLVTTGNLPPYARAMLVDENGRELPLVNGQYTTQQNGYLKIVATNPNHSIALDSLDSAENGKPSTTPPVAGTGRGFSYFFGLNNFFKGYESNGDTITNSALNFAVEDRILADPNLVSLGGLRRSSQPVEANANPLYTYERNIGDNSVIQQLANIANNIYSFQAAGGIGLTSTTFGSYAGAIIGSAASKASNVEADLKNSQTLMSGFTDRSDSISGVNLDEELANTVIYQNAYTASTRVITVVDELFDVLLNTFGR